MNSKNTTYPPRLAIVADVETPTDTEIYAHEIYGARRRRGHLLPACTHGSPGVRLFYADGDPTLPPGTEITVSDDIAFHPELTARMTHARESHPDQREFIRAACRLVREFIDQEHAHG